MEILKAVFFFYYCLILPCVWLGKKVVWGVFKDTQKQKEKATESVLKKAHRKGKLGKYHFDAAETQLKDTSRNSKVKGKNRKASKNIAGKESDKSKSGQVQPRLPATRRELKGNGGKANKLREEMKREGKLQGSNKNTRRGVQGIEDRADLVAASLKRNGKANETRRQVSR